MEGLRNSGDIILIYCWTIGCALIPWINGPRVTHPNPRE